MHVLPLPFGFRLAVAVLPRRDADLLRGAAAPVIPAVDTYEPAALRESIRCDLRYATARRHLV
jgi:hypothetical protein